MFSILYIQFLIPFILSLMVIVLFKKFKISEKISKKVNFKIKYEWILTLIIFLTFTFAIKPDVFEKITAFNELQNLNNSNVDKIEIVRYKRYDSNGEINYLKKKIEITEADSIREFLIRIKPLKFDLSERPGKDGLSWKCAIKKNSGNILYLNILKNKNKIHVSPRTKNGAIGFYQNNHLLDYLKSLEN